MAEYYSNSISRKRRRKSRAYSGKTLALFLLDIVVTLAMALLIFATVATIICQYISPEKSGVLSTLVLGAPIFYLLDIVVMFYWVVRWRWYRAAVMIGVVVLGLFYLSRYYKIDIDRHYDTSFKEYRHIKVMTYNVFEGKEAELPAYIKRHNPDILCLQEMNIGTDNWNTLTETYKTTYKPKVSTSGNQILTKYRIIRSGEIEGLERKSAVWADLKIKDDTVRVVSLHLKSTSIRPEDTQFLEKHQYLLDSQRESKLRSIVGRLTENNCKRAVQAEAVADFLAQSPYMTIVCGDFNDVPLSYTYNRIARNLDDTFSKMADGFAYTYNTKYRLLRIDNILVSPSVEVVSYEVDNDVDFSDHYPVIVRLNLPVREKID